MNVDGWRDAGRRLTVGGHTLFVADSDPRGSDKPALLLLHGFPTSSWDWGKVWPTLTRRYRCVAPDFLGFGFSDKPIPHRYRIHEQADLVETVVQRLALRSVHVLAHDYGDTVAQELLARDNARAATSRQIRSVCFLNGGLFAESHRARPIQTLLASPLGPLLARLLGRRSFARSLSEVFGPDTQPSPAELADWWRIISEGGGRHVFSSAITYMADRREHRDRWALAIMRAHCPVQLINGALDPVSGAHMVARYRALIDHGDVVEIPNVGHYPQVEAPERVLRAYLGWRDALVGKPPEQGYDVVITGACVFDGTGKPPSVHDVALRNGRVVARGWHVDHRRARQVVNGTGHWLMPGLVEIHTHYDLEVELEPGLPEAVRHGNTTVVMSNCSLGLAYGNQRRCGADPLVDCFARVENVPKDVLTRIADGATWTTSEAYLAHLDGLPLGPNVVPMIPHSMLRIEVMGFEGSLQRPPTAGELDRMEALVDRGMREGYAGMSTDALPFHYLANAPHQRSRIPGQYGSYAELSRLLSVVRRHDRVWQATPPKDRPLRVARLFSLTSGVLHGAPLRTTAVAALDVESNRSLVRLGRVLSLILNRVLGGRFRLQALAAPFKTWAEGAITPLAEEIEPLRVLNEPDLHDRAAREAIMSDPAWQVRFLAMWRKGKRGWSVARLKRWLRREDFAIQRDLRVMVVEHAPVPEWTGETLQQVFLRLCRLQAGDAGAARSEAEAQALGSFPDPVVDDARFVMHLLQTYDRELVWWTVSANADAAGVAERLMDPLLLPGFSDSGAHLVNMAFFDANLRALRIAQAEPDTENAVARMVRRLTREPATFFGLDTGAIEVGGQADLVLIDPVALRRWDPDTSVVRIHRDALDAEQLVNRPPGVVRGVWVAGEQVYDGEGLGEVLGRRALGRVLRPRNHWPTDPVAPARASPDAGISPADPRATAARSR